MSGRTINEPAAPLIDCNATAGGNPIWYRTFPNPIQSGKNGAWGRLSARSTSTTAAVK
jgi:hypothetical protein